MVVDRDVRSEKQDPAGWPADARRDRLIGDWHLYQRKGGHRTSTDDVVTAWFAVARSGGVTPDRYLDLGCGIGSVLLMVSHRLRPAAALGVEAQDQSVVMVRRTVAELPQGGAAIEILHGDFREVPFAGPEDAGGYDLITGSPPYFPIGTGVLPADAQRRACRFEVRGGVEGYCETAARCLSADGRFYLVFQTRGDARVVAAASAAGLHVTARADLFMREGRAEPFLTVYELRRSPATLETVTFAIRDRTGEITDEYMSARRELGVIE